MLAKYLHALEVEHEGAEVFGSSVGEPEGVEVLGSPVEEPEEVEVFMSSPVEDVAVGLFLTRVLDFSTHDSVCERK